MPKFNANLSFLYTEFDFLDRFAAAARNGFAGVEYLFPYSYPKEQLADILQKHSLTQVLHNLPAGNWDAGDRGNACQPNRDLEFQDGIEPAIEYAQALGCKQINCLAGIKPDNVTLAQAKDTFLRNLQYAAPRLAKHGIRLLIEPVNTYDIPGFYLSSTMQAIAIIKELGEENLFLQYDVYHMQMMEGNLANTIAKNFERISHIQLADVPGRHEPGTGEIRYDFLFDHLDRLGYRGWIGCEYKPLTTAEQGIGWMTSYKHGPAEK